MSVNFARIYALGSILRKQSRGFTLTEMAIVLVILALLLGGMIIPLGTQMDLRDVADSEKMLGEIKESLMGYAASHTALDGKPFFPCPDTDNDGIENRTGNACTSPEGRLPWNDLGIGRQDSWGNRFRYRVTPAFSNNAIGFTLNSTGTMRVCESSNCAVVVANTLPAIIVSHGKNGAGAYNLAGTTNPAPLGLDELANQDALNNDFVAHTQSTASGNEFDDLVTWVSSNILFNRMISAGKLP